MSRTKSPIKHSLLYLWLEQVDRENHPFYKDIWKINVTQTKK